MAWNAAVNLLPSTDWTRYRPKPRDIAGKVQTYFDSLPSRPHGPRYEQALAQTRADFKVPKVLPFHINDSIKHFQHPDRSPGLPYTKQGFKRKDEVDPNIIKQYVHNLKYGIYNKCTTPCNAVAKSMVGKSPKFRLIWVYPAHMTFAEGMFAMPLIRAYQQLRGSYAIWVRFAKGDLRFLKSLRHPDNTWLGLDWSAFDSRVPAWLIRDAFAILRDNLDFSRYDTWGKPTDGHTLDRLWKQVVDYFINTPVKLPSGRVLKKKQGVPSGSYFTSLIDSVCNSIVIHYLLAETSYARDHLWVLGDDCLVELSSSVNVSEMANVAEQVFGFTLNIDKTEKGDNVSFLGYKMSPEGYPKASFDKLLAQLLLPASPDRSLQEFAARARALQLSCFGHGSLRFTHMVQNVMDELGCTDIDPSFLHRRDELSGKLEQLGLAHWPPLKDVMILV
uniref:RdRp n=1 Tax=Hubei partiti-like virus 48 TaxID=1923056 RepID=A0A1L3KLD1_9VIRU|nr:RdRp [Hubei partiti-like virus 48]